jgi:hypothetical protein
VYEELVKIWQVVVYNSTMLEVISDQLQKGNKYHKMMQDDLETIMCHVIGWVCATDLNKAVELQEPRYLTVAVVEPPVEEVIVAGAGVVEGERLRLVLSTSLPILEPPN